MNLPAFSFRELAMPSVVSESDLMLLHLSLYEDLSIDVAQSERSPVPRTAGRTIFRDIPSSTQQQTSQKLLENGEATFRKV